MGSMGECPGTSAWAFRDLRMLCHEMLSYSAFGSCDIGTRYAWASIALVDRKVGNSSASRRWEL